MSNDSGQEPDEQAHAHQQSTGAGGVDWSTEPPPVYANGAHVVHTTREFSVILTDLAPYAGRGSAPGETEPRARVVASARMTPDVFFQLIASYASNWNKFVQQHGDPENTPRFKLIGAGGYQLEGLEEAATAPAGSGGTAPSNGSAEGE